MVRAIALFACLEVAAFAAAAPPEEKDKKGPPKPIALSLKVGSKVVKMGGVLEFRLTLKNTSDQPQLVLDLPKRPDLQSVYFKLQLTREGEEIHLKRTISDTERIGDEDFLKLAPGRSVTFKIADQNSVLEQLQPGKYKACIRFWQDPNRNFRSAYYSPEVEFTLVD